MPRRLLGPLAYWHLRSEIAYSRLLQSYWGWRIRAKYNPNQPRIPAGGPGGGRWTDGSGATDPRREALLDRQANPARIGRPLLEPGGGGGGGWGRFRPEPTRPAESPPITNPASPQTRPAPQTAPQPAPAPRAPTPEPIPPPPVIPPPGPTIPLFPVPLIAPLVPESAIDLFNARTVFGVPNRQDIPVLAAEFAPGDSERPVVRVDTLDERRAQLVCRRLGDYQGFVQWAVADTNPSDYQSPATYGTAVHVKVRDAVENLGNPDFRAEVSVSKTKIETGGPPRAPSYGDLGSIRYDAFDFSPENRSVCIYDLKTGRRGVTTPEVEESMERAFRRFPLASRFFFVQVRPR